MLLALVLSCMAAGLVVLVVLGFSLHDGSGRSDTRIALDTAAATIALLLAFLLFGRFRETRLVRDALLCAFLALLGGANAFLSVVPRLLDAGPSAYVPGSAFAALLAGTLFAVAMWSRTATWELARAPLLLGAGVLLLLELSYVLGRLSGIGVSFASADTFGASAAPALTVVQILTAVALLVAALGCVRSAGPDEQLLIPLVVTATLGTASRLCYAASSLAADGWSTAGTALRALFYLTLVVAAGLEISGYWRRVADLAVLEERRRIARDLHDGLAQELAFASTQARSLAEISEHPTRARLIAAATERALDESRGAIAALTRPLDEPIAASLAQCGEEVCGRFGARLDLQVEPDVQVTGQVREALLRIVREAVSNAVRHGAAGHVRVTLVALESGVRLAVEDDGTGFDVDSLHHLSGRFGLVSMRERTEALGGTFALTSREPTGTCVRVCLP